MEVFGELLKDDVGLLSLAVIAGTLGVLIFYIIYILAKAGKN